MCQNQYLFDFLVQQFHGLLYKHRLILLNKITYTNSVIKNQKRIIEIGQKCGLTNPTLSSVKSNLNSISESSIIKID